MRAQRCEASELLRKARCKGGGVGKGDAASMRRTYSTWDRAGELKTKWRLKITKGVRGSEEG
jgi:hypothetical protein